MKPSPSADSSPVPITKIRTGVANGAALPTLLSIPFIDSIGAGFGQGYKPSGVVALSAGGEIIYERAFGRADVERDEPNSEGTIFRIGAISAQFTAGAILRLAQAKKLSLNAPIATFLPDYPAPGARVPAISRKPISDVMVHLAGKAPRSEISRRK